MRRLRARLSTIDQLEAFLFWPAVTMGFWILFFSMCLVNSGPLLVYWGILAMLSLGWCTWRVVTMLRRAARWRPPPWAIFCREMQDSTDFHALSDAQFRSLLMWLYRYWGYTCDEVGDGGNFILLWPDPLSGELRDVAEMQCITRPLVVGPKLVNLFITHITRYNAQHRGRELGGYLVTPYRFDLPARVLGARTPTIHLIDGADVIRWLMRRSGELYESPQEIEEDTSMRVTATLSLIS